MGRGFTTPTAERPQYEVSHNLPSLHGSIAILGLVVVCPACSEDVL